MQRQVARPEFVQLEKAPPKACELRVVEGSRQFAKAKLATRTRAIKALKILSRPRCAAKLRLFRVFKLLAGLKAMPPVARPKQLAASARRVRWTP